MQDVVGFVDEADVVHDPCRSSAFQLDNANAGRNGYGELAWSDSGGDFFRCLACVGMGGWCAFHRIILKSGLDA